MSLYRVQQLVWTVVTAALPLVAPSVLRVFEDCSTVGLSIFFWPAVSFFVVMGLGMLLMPRVPGGRAITDRRVHRDISRFHVFYTVSLFFLFLFELRIIVEWGYYWGRVFREMEPTHSPYYYVAWAGYGVFLLLSQAGQYFARRAQRLLDAGMVAA